MILPKQSEKLPLILQFLLIQTAHGYSTCTASSISTKVRCASPPHPRDNQAFTRALALLSILSFCMITITVNIEIKDIHMDLSFSSQGRINVTLKGKSIT